MLTTAKFWRLLGGLILGGLLAKWTWILFAPEESVIAVRPEQGAAVETAQLFGRTVSGTPASGGTVLPNVRLLGVFAGSPGFAVLELDGRRQVAVAAGEKVTPTVQLLQVAADYIVLEQAGVRQQVNLEGEASAIATAQAAMVPAGPEGGR